MIDIGTTAKKLRLELGWTQRETAIALDISYVHLSNIENNKSMPSQDLLDRYLNLWGIDLYVFSWCENDDVENLPQAVQNAALMLSNAWRKRVKTLIKEQRKKKGTGVPCITSET